jgi:hypothetical protein
MQEKELMIEEVALDETEIIEDAVTPAAGIVCGLGCVGSLCGVMC